MAYGLTDIDAVIAWTEADEGRPAVELADVPLALSERGQRVLRTNARLRGLCDESIIGFPSDSERANSIAWHAGLYGLTKEDAAWLLGEFYRRPGKKPLHSSKLRLTLRAWAKGREEAMQHELRVPSMPPPEANPAGAAPSEPTAPVRPSAHHDDERSPTVLQPYTMLVGPAFMQATFSGASRIVPSIGLTERGAGLLTGLGGDGKSVCGINLALAWTGARLPIAAVIPAARTLRVMMFQVEDTPGIVQERLQMIGTPVPENLILFTRNEPIHFSGAKGKPNLTALARLGKTLAAHAPIDVVMFDPLVYLHEAEENSASEMMRWLVPFREVCREAGAAPFVIHHAGWAADGDDARGRGSSAIRAWSDLELTLRAESKNGKTLHRLNLKKANFAQRWTDAITLQLDPKTLIFTPVDEAETLCSTASPVEWMLEDLNGIWTGKRADLYTKICAKFNCSDKTARVAVAAAIKEGKLKDHGQRKPLEVVTGIEETLL